MANIEDLRDRSVSSGTLKSEDLIPKFLGVLKTYGKDKYDKYIKENPEVEDWKNLDEETMGWVVDELTDLLNEIAPDGCYFGASEGDGADFGFWSMSNESKKSEGNDDDKGCKGKDCKDDKTKKNEADATFKVGDFVNYDAESDGKDVYDSFIPCEVVDVNDDGTLDLCVYGSYVDEEGLGENASASCCSKLDHYAGMVDANHYYMGGKYNAYRGGWEILITDKELNPKVYEFIGTIDDLSEVLDIDDFYGGENFVFDEDLKDEVANNTGWDVETTPFADMTGDVGESKQTEGLPPKKLGNRLYRSRADLINKMKTLDAVEITTPAQFNDIHSKQWLHTAGYAMDINGNLVGQTYFGDKDGKWYYATTKTFQGDYLPECKQNEASPDVATIEGLKSLLGRGIAVADNELRCKGVWKLNSKNPRQHQWTFVGDNGSISVKTDDDFKVIRIWGDLNKKSFDLGVSENKEEAKKSKSTENTTESERISFITDLANKLGIDNLEEDRASAHMSGWRYFNNDDEGGDGVVLSLKAYPWARDDQSATIDIWLETWRGVIGDCWLSFDFGGDYKNRINADTILTTLKTQLHTLWSRREGVAKKSESLTLKQKELKDMARFGQAEDITTISDAEAKELKKKGIETIGVSRGTYGMNGALLRDNEGNKYVITARSSNLFYFV